MCQSSISGQPSRRWKIHFTFLFLGGEYKKTNRNRQAIARHAKVKNTRHKIKKFYFFFFIVMGSTPRGWGICKSTNRKNKKINKIYIRYLFLHLAWLWCIYSSSARFLISLFLLLFFPLAFTRQPNIPRLFWINQNAQSSFWNAKKIKKDMCIRVHVCFLACVCNARKKWL